MHRLSPVPPVDLRGGRLSPSAPSLDPPTPVRSGSITAFGTPQRRAQRANSIVGRRGRFASRNGDESVDERILTGVRVRPPLAWERKKKDASVCVKLEPPDTVVLTDAGAQKSVSFECSRVFDSSDPSSDDFATQEAVYNGLGAQIVEHAASGYNCCLCAYGQTGTGKTYTIHGEWNSPDGRGLLPRIAEGLLSRCEEFRKEGAEVRVHASYIEIYNNKLFDLLERAQSRGGKGRPSSGRPSSPPAAPGGRKASPSPPPGPGRKANSRLEIHTHPTIGVYVDNLSEIAVSSTKEVGRLVAIGDRAKHIATTSMNARSSRSHTVFTFKIEVLQKAGQGGPRSATVQIVDLAGRENEQTSECKGERFKELTFINRSLFQLANCVHALSEGGDHVPFRNSKLTMLLSESFQRNSRTHLLATLTPSSSGFEENLLTCRFLESTGRITTQPLVNRFCSEDLQGQLLTEIESLQREVGDTLEGRPSLLKSRQLLLAHITQGIIPVQALQRHDDERQGEKEAVVRDACEKVGQSLAKASERLLLLASEHEAIKSCLGRAEIQLKAVEAQAEQYEHWDLWSQGQQQAAKLPPLETPAQGGVNKAMPTVTFAVSLPPIVILE